MRRLLVLSAALVLCGLSGSSARATGVMPIAQGDLIVSTLSNQVDEYTPSGAFVQTLMDGSNGLGLPTGAAFDGSGNLYVTDFANNQILKRDPSGAVTVFADDTTLGNGHVLNAPESIVFNLGYSKMYVSDANRGGEGGGINVIDTANGAGSDFYALPSSSGSEGTGESDWLALDANSDLYMTNEDPTQGIMKVDQATGDIVQPSFVEDLPNDGYALSFDKNGNLWLGATDRIMEFAPSGSLLNTITNPDFSTVFAAVFNPSGDEFYAGDLDTGEVYTYSLDGTLQSSFSVGSGVSGLAVAGARVSPNPPERYVALGDSVPYGHGLVNPYPKPYPGLASTDRSEGPSPFAYPGLLEQYYGLNMSIRGGNCVVDGSGHLLGDDLAFSGAAITRADASSKTNDQCPQQFKGTVTVQGDEVPAASLASDPAQLVTIQAGADDIQFSRCLEWELLKFGPLHLGTQCVSNGQVTSAVSKHLANVHKELLALLLQISPHTHMLAVLNYYQPIPRPQDFKKSSVFFPNGPNGPNATVDEVCWALNRNLNGAYHDAVIIQNALNKAIDSAVADARAHGATNVKLVNISKLELTHEMCTANPAIFSGVSMPRSQFNHDLETIYLPGSRASLTARKWRTGHPNQFGQDDIAKAVEAVVGTNP